MYLLPAQSTIGRVFSYGGGVQSNAVLVLQATGKLTSPYDAFVFANVGADSENPDTLDYVETVAKPYAAKHGIRFVEVQKMTFGKPETLYSYMYRTPKSVPIPVFFEGSGYGRRACTVNWKLDVVDAWIASQGWQYTTIGLGISVDEWHRARDTQWHARNGLNIRRMYPLLSHKLRRADCLRLVADAGLPEPPRSACWFCPFTKSNEWVELKRNNPDLFQKAIELEQHINTKRPGNETAFLHRSRRPLDQAVGDQLPMWPEWDTCDEGVCFV